MAGREAWKLERRRDDKSLKLLSEEEEKKIGKQWKDKEKPRSWQRQRSCQRRSVSWPRLQSNLGAEIGATKIRANSEGQWHRSRSVSRGTGERERRQGPWKIVMGAEGDSHRRPGQRSEGGTSKAIKTKRDSSVFGAASQAGFLETDWGRQGVAPSDQGGSASPPVCHPASSGSTSEASRFASVARLCEGLFAGGSGDSFVPRSGQEDQILGSNLSQSQKGFSKTEADHRFALAQSVCACKASQVPVMDAYHGGPEGPRTVYGH